MRSLGDGWETVLVAQQKAMFPYLCVRWPWADRYLRECSCAPVLTMGQALLMRLCWQRDEAGQHWCHPGVDFGLGSGHRPYLCRHDCELVANWMTRP